MLRLSVVFTLIFAAAAAAVACDPFAPDLGDVPYRCGSDDPKCPDGYEPVDVGQPAICECHKIGSGSHGPDASPANCGDETEPNDIMANARNTPVGSGATTADFSEEICTDHDVDIYKFTATQPNQKITATLQFNSTIGTLNLRITNAVGTILGAGPMPQGPTALVATATLEQPGTYFVHVNSASGTNTYTLSLALQ